MRRITYILGPVSERERRERLFLVAEAEVVECERGASDGVPLWQSERGADVYPLARLVAEFMREVA